MTDLLPNATPDALPDMGAGLEHAPATVQHLATLGQASNEVFNAISVPTSAVAWEGMVASQIGEAQMRRTMALSESSKLKDTSEDLAREAIIAGATPEDVEAILGGGNTLADVTDATLPEDNVLERGAAQFLVNQGFKNPERAASILNEEFKDVDIQDTDERENFTATMLRLNTLQLKLKQKWEGQNFAEKTMDFLTMIVPGIESESSARVFGREFELLSTSVLKFSEKFWSAPVAKRMEMIKTFEKALDDNTILGENVLQAMGQLNDLLRFKPEDAVGRDFIEALDATVILSPLAWAFRTAKTVSGAARIAGAKDIPVARAVNLRELDRAKARGEAEGVPYRAADEDEMINSSVPSSATPDQRIEKASGPAVRAQENADLERNFQTVAESVVAGAERHNIPIKQDASAVDLLALLKGVVTPEVLNKAEQGAANTAAVRTILRQFDIDTEQRAIIDPESLTNGRVTTDHYPMYDVRIDDVSGVRTVHVFLGTGEGRMKGFVTQEAALAGAERMGLEKGFFKLSNRSGEWFVRVSRNPGTNQFIEGAKVSEFPNVLPILGRYLQGKKTVSTLDDIKGARLATSAASRLQQGISAVVDQINRLRGASRKTYNNLMLDIQQTEKWKTPSQLDEFYIDNYQRLPSEREKGAYAATRQLYDFDYVIRNIALRDELIGAGFQEVKVKGVHATPVVGKQVATTSVEPSRTRIYDTRTNDFVAFGSREQLAKTLADGDLVLIKTLEDTKEFGQYIITIPGGFNVRDLRANVLNKVDGPHRMYAGDNFIKQQRVRFINGQETIVSPRTHFAIESKADAQKYVDDYNRALEAYLSAKTSNSATEQAQASAIISRNTIFSSFDDMDLAVKEGRMETTPFERVGNGELPSFRTEQLVGTRTIDPDFANLSDDIQHLVGNGRMFYSSRGPRLLHPKEGMAALLKPEEILKRAISNVVNTQAYSRYKQRQVTRWDETFGKYMIGFDPARPAVERFMFGKFDTRPNATFKLAPNVMRAAEAQRAAIKRFLNTTGALEDGVKRVRDEIVDIIDARGFRKTADRFATLTSSNPIAHARGFAFKFYLGSADVSQLFVQMAMWPGIATAFPKNGVKMMSALPHLRAALLNPQHAGSMAKNHSRFTAGLGLKPNQFVEMVEDIQKAGVDIVDGNLGDLDNLAGVSNLMGNTRRVAKKATDMGAVFFREAEKANRIAGFGMAWLEFFNKTGRRPKSADEFAEVGVRGDAFSGNMNRDGKAAWQDGLPSLGTQFWGHPARVIENLIAPTPGGLKGMDKARLYTGLALWYGPMLGTGGAIATMVAEQMRETGASEEAINLATRGIAGYLLPETDTQRIEPFGNVPLADLFTEDGDLQWSKALFGASGELGSRFIEATIGSAKLWALYHGQVETDQVPLALQDIGNDILKTLSSYSRGEKAVHVWQTRQLLSARGTLLQEDLDKFDAVLVGLGFPPIESSNAFEALSNHKDMKTKVFKDARTAVGFLMKALRAEPGTDTYKRNLSYFNHMAKLNALATGDGTNGRIFAREVDKLMHRQGAYNEQVYRRIYRDLQQAPHGLVRQ